MLQETEPPTKELGPKLPCTYVAVCSLDFMQVTQQLEQGLSLTLWPNYGSCFPNWTTLAGLSGRGYAQSFNELGQDGTHGCLFLLRGEEEEGIREGAL